MAEPVIYGCSCGWTGTLPKHAGHIMTKARIEGAEAHRSIGRITSNLPPTEAGEVDEPDEPDAEQEEQEEIDPKKPKKTKQPIAKTSTTEVIASALSLRLVPRTMQCTFTPIMSAGIAACIGPESEFKWREGMPLENFFDTIIYEYCYEHGVQLGGYIVNADLRDALEKDDAADVEERDDERDDERTNVEGNGKHDFEFLKILEEV